jgi:hypothetical protein
MPNAAPPQLDVREIRKQFQRLHPPSNAMSIEPEFSLAEEHVMKVVEQYKRENRRPFPTISEILLVITCMGYRQVEPPGLPAEVTERLSPERAARPMSAWSTVTRSRETPKPKPRRRR